MLVPGIKELSSSEENVRITNPIDVCWMLVFQSRGLVDADFEQSIKSARHPRPRIYAVVHGLTYKGLRALKKGSTGKIPNSKFDLYDI